MSSVLGTEEKILCTNVVVSLNFENRTVSPPSLEVFCKKTCLSTAFLEKCVSRKNKAYTSI